MSINKIKELTLKANEYRNAYYNQSTSIVSDAEYDKLIDELAELEKKENFSMSNSPTRTVGYDVVSELEKTTHTIPLLSLEKTKLVEELLSFADKRQMVMMLKFDGLTVKLTYENGVLIEAATRGNGEIGEIITHNASTFKGVPTNIPFKERLVITGEAFIHLDDFEYLQSTLVDSNGDTYKTARNLASGSVRLLDSNICKDRRISFSPFNVLERYDTVSQSVNSKTENLILLQSLGFELYSSYAPIIITEDIGELMDSMVEHAKEQSIPIDGLVFTFDDISYSKSLGRTGHHFKDGLAFKFEDESFETMLKSIEWTPSRTGEITPVALLQTVNIDGTDVSRASLHNLSFIKDLELMPDCKVMVSKRNMIIPHIEDNLERGRFNADKLFPDCCPCCGYPTRIHKNTINKSKVIETLFCDNEACESRKLRSFVHFVSKKALDIVGLSEYTLEKFIDCGFLHNLIDVYSLDKHKDEIIEMDGFGEKSYKRLWDAIEASKNTSFERYVIAMDIPMIGNSASRTLEKTFDGNLDYFIQAVDTGFDFTELADFGETLHGNIHSWFTVPENRTLFENLQKIMNLKKKEVHIMSNTNNQFAGKTIVVTGKVEPYTRDEIHEVIIKLGAHPGSSISKKTDYLICGEKAGSKLQKAIDLGIPVLKPAEFDKMVNV